MKLTRIDSTNARQPSWQILKEWEEVLSQKTGLPVYRDNRLIRYIKAHFDKWGMSFLWKKIAEFAIILELNGYSDCLKIR